MNCVHGDKVNVFAAEKAVATTDNLCRCIWMPTQDAVYQNVRYHGKKEGIAILDENGAVLPEVVRVIDVYKRQVFDCANILIASFFTDDRGCAHENREHTLIYLISGELEIEERGKKTVLHPGA